MSSRSAKGISEDIWQPLMAPVTEKEVSDTILSLHADTAVDLQGNSSNLFKALFFCGSPLLPHLTALVNGILETGDLPSNWKEFYVVMIEKKVGEVKLDSFEADLRPISIINEYVKLVCRFLANRLSQLLQTTAFFSC